MRTTIATAVIWVLIGAWAGSASAALTYDYSGSAAPIPDNDAVGQAFAFSITDPATSISSVTVTVDISGGYNGDLYVYLSHGSGFAVLLNRVGVGTTTSGSSASGYANTGFSLTFDGTASANAHFYQNNSPSYNGSGQLTGMWRPDGRMIDPESAAATFESASTSANFSTFAGLNPNGNWTLFVSDVSGGSISTLNDFTVNISAVPEPVNAALGIFGSLIAVGCALRSRWGARILLRGNTRTRR